jgi:hypothetical protein
MFPEASEPNRDEGTPRGGAPEKETADMFSRQEHIDYLDIPSFLRIQAD